MSKKKRHESKGVGLFLRNRLHILQPRSLFFWVL